MPKKRRSEFLKILVSHLLLWLIFISPASLQAAGEKVALLPLALHAGEDKGFLRQGLESMFLSRLSGEGLEVIGHERLDPLLSEAERQGVTSEGRAAELGRQVAADYVVFGSITTLGGGYSLDLSLLDLTKEAAKPTRISEAATEAELIPKLSDVVYRFRAAIQGYDIRARAPAGPAEAAEATPGEETARGIFYKPTGEGRAFQPTGKLSVRMHLMGFDAGDLDGDGQAEWAILGRERLVLYSRKGETLEHKATLKSGVGEDFLKVSLGDADRDGKAEVYVVSRYGLRARTTVYAWAGKLKELDRRYGHMRAVRDPDGRRSMILFQKSETNRFFSEGISILGSDGGGKYSVREELPRIKDLQFYSVALMDLDGDGSREIVGLDGDDYLRVWDAKGKGLWKSEDKIGGTNNTVEIGYEDKDLLLPKTFVFNSAVITADVDKDGKKEVLVIKNIPAISNLKNLKYYLKGQMVAYSIEGTSLFPAWKTRNMNYCLTDIQADGDTLILAAQKGKFDTITKGSGRIMWFE